VFFFSGGGEKKYFDGGASLRGVSAISQPHEKTATVISSAGETFTSSTNYDHALTYFRGIQKTLTIKSSGAGTTVNQPRVLNGLAITARASNASNGIFSEITITAAFQEQRTVIANNADKTLDQARADLIAELQSHGFTAFTL
jgi:hypothetical protein